MLTLLLLTTLAAGLGLAAGPRVAWRRWLHRGCALGFIVVASLHGATLLVGSGLLVALGGVLAARLPDRDWALALLLAHGFGAICLLFILGLQALR